MTTRHSTTDMRRKTGRGQAMVETAIGLAVMAFVIAALAAFAGIFLGDMDMIAAARADTGTSALGASGGSAHGNGFAITSRTHPSMDDYAEAPVVSSAFSDPYSYPCAAVPDNVFIARFRDDTAVPLLTIAPFAQTRNFPVDLSLLGSGPLFPDGFDFDETIYMPPLGQGGMR